MSSKSAFFCTLNLMKKNKKKFKNTIDNLKGMWYNDNVKRESPLIKNILYIGDQNYDNLFY